MRFEATLQRLRQLPTPLPPAPAEIDARILSAGPLPEGIQRDMAGPARDAAALMLIYPDARGEARIVLTVRPGGSHVHAGQVALPGGKREPGDAFPEGTALREAREEVGLDVGAAEVSALGVLDVIDVRVSGFMMVPVVAVAQREPTLVADEREVALMLGVPVRHFLPDAPVEVVEEERAGWHLRYGAYPVAGHHVWGATGRALGQLGAVLGTD